LAQEQFSVCIHLDPNYLPAYVELGKCYRWAGQFPKAREIWSAGLKIAANQGQQHTQDYIRQQLEGLPRDSGPDGAKDGSRG
jgi:tetratricopeptide (TPR) repeat protein